MSGVECDAKVFVRDLCCACVCARLHDRPSLIFGLPSLTTVRTQKALQRQLMASEGRSDTDDSSDAGSEASFASSRSSARSSAGSSAASTRSKREKKQRAPRLSSREGGPREEEFLHSALKAALPTAAALADTAALLRALALFGQLTRARAVQSAQEALLATVAAATELLAVPPAAPATVDPAPPPPPPALVPIVDWRMWWA